MGHLIVGCDVGQRVDPTAIAVAECEWREVADRSEDHWTIRHLERLLGLGYPTVADRLAEVVDRVSTLAGSTPALYVDATGIGTALVDLMHQRGVRAIPVYFTYGDKRTAEGGKVTLGKGWLVSRLQSLLQGERIHLPRTDEAEALASELLTYEIKVDPDGDAKFGAFKTGKHDDLVTAVGLATQVAPAGGVAFVSLEPAGQAGPFSLKGDSLKRFLAGYGPLGY